MPSSRGSSQPRDQIQFSALQVDSLPSEPPGNATHSCSCSCVISASLSMRAGMVYCPVPMLKYFSTFRLTGTADSRRRAWADDFHVCSSPAPCSWPYCGTYTPVSSFFQPIFGGLFRSFSVTDITLGTSSSAKTFLHTFGSQTHHRIWCESEALFQKKKKKKGPILTTFCKQL